MLKKTLIQAVAEEAFVPTRETGLVLEALVRVMVRQLASQRKKIRIPNLGTFSVVRRNGKVWRNPKTKKIIHVASMDAIHFKPSLVLKERFRNKEHKPHSPEDPPSPEKD